MLIELSYPLSLTAPKWPTNPDEQYYVIASPQNGDINTTNSVYHHLHNGTHFDAPRHFDATGLTVEALPIEDFYYTNACVIPLSKEKGEPMTLEDVLAYEKALQQSDILLLYSGYSKYRETEPEHFMDDFPYIDPKLAKYLRKSCPKLKAVALDTLSVDSSVLGGKLGFPAHHALLDHNAENPERTIRIFEDVNVSKLLHAEKIRAICSFPVRWEGMEAAPVAMVAITD